MTAQDPSRNDHDESEKATEQTLIEAPASHAEPDYESEPQPEPAPTPKAPRAKPTKTKSGAGWVAWLALLLALGGLGAMGAAYWYWQQLNSTADQQQQQWLTEQNARFTALEQQIGESLKAADNKLTQGMEQSVNLSNNLMTSLDNRVKGVESLVAEVSGRQPNDWILAEAHYLIRLAGHKLWLEHDKQSALSLLASAAMRLQQIGDPSLLPLRKAIGEDIATLYGLPDPRVIDIHLTLSGVINQVDSLPVNGFTVEAVSAAPAKPDRTRTDDPADWMDNLYKNVAEVGDLLFDVQTKVADGEIESWVQPTQQWYLRANLKTALLQAQLAALQRDQRVFDDAVKMAQHWLDRFQATDVAVQAASGTLAVLLEHPIVAKYPERMTSQALAEQLLHQRLGKAFDAAQTPTEQQETATPGDAL